MLPPCQACTSVRDHEYFVVPVHAVHPDHGKRMTFYVRGEAVCPTCGTRWRARIDNTFEIVVGRALEIERFLLCFILLVIVFCIWIVLLGHD